MMGRADYWRQDNGTADPELETRQPVSIPLSVQELKFGGSRTDSISTNSKRISRANTYSSKKRRLIYSS